MPKPILPIILLIALLPAACDDKKDTPRAEAAAGAAPPVEVTEARRAAEEQLRARLRMTGEMPLRAVQVWRQQLPGTLAVCGQVNPAGGASDPFIPWVATVALAEGRAQRTELVLGASNAEASRVYVEMVDRCFDGGGPRTAQGGRDGARPLPPLPLDAALSQARVPAAAPGPGTSATGAPAAVMPALAGGRQVTTSQAHPVNIRSTPGGGGAVVRVVPRASTLRVFGEAPGGWLQVGEDQPFGWVHASVLER
ncbi:SH3 domain-containing protein [Dankookia sp. P2]|uniref:SH3 domain-containing protein n=1 Tax=Dankookia sp. P2 TaxID=3423955 RepID=UPI003D66BA70